MKKFIKFSLGLASFFAIVGVVSMIAAFAMGMNWNQLVEMAQNGELAIQKDDSNGNVSFFKYEKHHEHGDCKNLEIEFSAGTLNILYDDVKDIEVQQEGIKNFSSKMDGHTLEIRGSKNNFSNGSKGYVTIIIPEGYVFEEVDMEIGAGQAEINDLHTQLLDIEVGAGQAELMNLDVKYLNATAGAGQITAELVGSEKDYSYDVECGIGEIVIGENSYGGFGRDTHIENSGAERKVDIECGVGQIVIEFEE